MLLHTRFLLRTLPIIACCFVSACAHQKVALNFQDAQGCSYSTAQIVSDFKTCHGSEHHPNVLMVLSDQPDNPVTSQQISALQSVDLQNLNLIVVRGYASGVDSTGYFMDSALSQSLLGNRPFALYLYSPEGKLLSSSSDPLSVEQISELL